MDLGGTSSYRITCFRLEVWDMYCSVQKEEWLGMEQLPLKKSIKEKDGSSGRNQGVIYLTDCRF